MTIAVEPYRERPARVAGAELWTRTAEGGEFRILPDGCMDLLLMDDELYVAGPDDRAWVGSAPRGTRYAGIRFAPGAAPGFFGVPARELLNELVPLADLWSPNRTRRLLDRILPAPDQPTALDLEVARLAEEPTDALTAQVLHSVRSGLLRGTAGVSRLAGTIGLSERQLHRRCLDAFGYGPKLLDRVLWMNVALDHARTGLPLADVAMITGYADQAHLTRDVKALTGLPPKILIG
ncbi:helix-turn-helix domain-containing protein [Kribbella sp.]|uniref:helix-turn-helix domain-containing protein n=1 Tax=Kribbella sp. TaxID=1871183 RepID=UPI002D319798|nr:helix-turn-helix domain-containing protein [Kribbella sp.]HZX06516.1 helix-turn-helix domain-containing protein [Kribbella sp.]